jgi:hypothetical protein
VTRRIRWHWAVAALSFAVLAVFRGADGSWPAAGLFGALAVAGLVLAIHRPAPTATRDDASPTSVEAVRRTLDVHRTRLTTWRVTVAGAAALTVAGLFLFPPLSLVTGASAVIAVIQCRRYGRTTRVLVRAADRMAA